MALGGAGMDVDVVDWEGRLATSIDCVRRAVAPPLSPTSNVTVNRLAWA
jgi:hypothetical protein